MIAYINGKIVTLDEQRSIVSALLLYDGKIIKTGNDQEILHNLPESVEIVDLGGQTVLPGIVDSHNHIIEAGITMNGVLLFDCKNMEDVKNLVAAKAQTLKPGEWIEGAGWIDSQFAENRSPTRWELDQAAPNNPVYLNRLFGGAVVNSLALKAAGIHKGSPQPESGTICLDEDGEPNGYLINNAQRLVRAQVPRNIGATNKLAETMAAIERVSKEYLRYGITTIMDPGVGPEEMKAYQIMKDSGRLPQRVAMMPAWYGLYATQNKDLSNLVPSLGVFEGFGDERLRFAALKMAIDGGVGSKTAMMNEPWKDGSQTTIPLRLDIEKLEEYFTEGHEARWSIGIHCCGDRAQDLACQTFDKVLSRDKEKQARRHHIIHGYFPTEESLQIMEKWDIGVSVQPGFIWVEGDIYFDNLETEKVNTFKPLRTYLDRGIRVFANSDMTSAHYNPFLGMAAAVTRRTSKGAQLGQAECIEVMEMLEIFIKNSAYYCGLENEVGSLEPGKRADFIILSDDILEIDEEAIRDLQVEATYIEGKLVYSR